MANCQEKKQRNKVVVARWGGGKEGGQLTPHDGPHARYQLYHLVLDPAVDILSERALVRCRGEADCMMRPSERERETES